MSVCLFVCMCVLVVVSWILSICDILEFTIIGCSPVNTNIPVSKIGTLQICLKTQNHNFFKNCANSFHYISVIQGDHHPGYNCVGGISRKVTIWAQGAKMVTQHGQVLPCIKSSEQRSMNKN
jgi:hypothetical protein